jgi:hypothetical protein
MPRYMSTNIIDFTEMQASFSITQGITQGFDNSGVEVLLYCPLRRPAVGWGCKFLGHLESPKVVMG